MSKKTFRKVRGFSIFFIVLLAIISIVISMSLLWRGEIGEGTASVGLFAIPLALIFGGGYTIYAVSLRFWTNYYERIPEVTVQAKVFAKAVRTEGGEFISDGEIGYTSAVTTAHFVSFEFDGRRENIQVDISFFNTVQEGETGLLKYKEIDEEFIFFDFKRNT